MKMDMILKLARPVLPIIRKLFATADESSADGQIDITVDGEPVKPTELLELMETGVIQSPKRVEIKIFSV